MNALPLLKKDVAVVIPSVRSERCSELVEKLLARDYLAPDQIWVHWDRPDHMGYAAPILPAGVHLTTQDMVRQRDRWDIFSYGDAACRIYPFALAVREGAKAILTLDDDCSPQNGVEKWVRGHLDNLNGLQAEPGWYSTTKGPTRGMPFGDVDVCRKAYVSHGLWYGAQDDSAVHRLAGTDNGGHREGFIPRDVFYPMCGMNLAFRAEMLPAMFFPKMGEGSPYARYDDIWAGLISKVVMDHLGLRVYSGEPKVTHRCESNRFDNLRKETPGILDHEYVWRAFEASRDLGDATSIAGATSRLASNLQAHHFAPAREIGRQLADWHRWLREGGPHER